MKIFKLLNPFLFLRLIRFSNYAFPHIFSCSFSKIKDRRSFRLPLSDKLRKFNSDVELIINSSGFFAFHMLPLLSSYHNSIISLSLYLYYTAELDIWQGNFLIFSNFFHFDTLSCETMTNFLTTYKQ